MTADLLNEIAEAGGQLWLEGDRVRYRLPRGRADLLQQLQAHREEIREAVLLRQAAEGLDIGPDEVRAALDASDIAELRAGQFSATNLRAFAVAVVEMRQRERGQVPEHYTGKTFCESCTQTVPIFPSCPPVVAGCPWCWNRARGLPVPSIEEQPGR